MDTKEDVGPAAQKFSGNFFVLGLEEEMLAGILQFRERLNVNVIKDKLTQRREGWVVRLEREHGE